MPKKYAAEDLAQAINEVKNGKLSVYKASKTYNIPKSTLSDKLKQRYKNDVAGRPAVLTKEEEDLITKWILGMAEIGFPVTKENLLNSVNKLVGELQRPNTFKNGLPGRHWYDGFMTRNPSIAKRINQSLVHARANVGERQLRDWFQKVHEYFVNNNFTDVLEDPSRVFNADESAFFLCPKGDAVLAKKGAKTVYSRSGNNEKECITVLIGASANGKMMPPLALFPFKRLPKCIVAKYPKNWAIGRSDSGWMTAESFFEYIANIFNPFLENEKIKKPVVLFLDGHVSHLSLHLCDFSKQNGIILVALLPHSTHILQPMDVSVFRPLKGAWAKAVRNWRIENNGDRLKKEDFAPILCNAIETSLNAEIISNGFRKCGLYPFNANAIDYGSFLKHTNTSAVHLPLTPLSSSKTSHLADPADLANFAVADMNNEFIKIFENRLGHEKLKCFQESDEIWIGDVRDENLFYFSKSLSNQKSSTLLEFGNSTLNANICLEENFTTDFDNIFVYETHLSENNKTQNALQELLTPTPEKAVDTTPEKSAKHDEIEHTLQANPAQTSENTKIEEFPTPFNNRRELLSRSVRNCV